MPGSSTRQLSNSEDMRRVDVVDGTELVPGLTAEGEPVAITAALLRSTLVDKIYGSRAELYADLAHPANTQAAVVGDGTVIYDGRYKKNGGTGSGSWTQVSQDAFHETATDNPHQTTAEQVGLGAVDNTADVDKPVSTAQQSALDDKASGAALAALGEQLDAKLGASALQVPTFFGDDPENPRPLVAANRSNSFIYLTPMVEDVHVHHIDVEGEVDASEVRLFNYTSDGTTITRDDASELVIPVGVNVVSQDISYVIRKGNHLGIATNKVKAFANGEKMQGFFGEDLSTSGFHAYDGSNIGSSLVLSSAGSGVAASRAVVLSVFVDDLEGALDARGIATKEEVQTATDDFENRYSYGDFGYYDWFSDDVFAAMDVAASAGTSSAKWIFADAVTPVDGYLVEARLNYGSANNGETEIRVYEPDPDGTHNLISEHTLTTGTAVDDKKVLITPKIFLKKGQRLAFLNRGLRSSFGQGFVDNTGGTRTLEGGFDPETVVWNTATSDSRRVYGIGFRIEGVNTSPRQEVKNSHNQPAMIALKRCGQSNDEWVSAAPIYEQDVRTYLQQLEGRNNQAGAFNAIPLTLPGPASSFCDTARAISQERFGFKPSFADVDGSRGGTAISGLLRGNADYTLGLDIMGLVDKLENGMQVPFNVFTQGESDQTASTTRESYYSQLLLLARQLSEDDVSISPMHPMMYLQCTTHFSSNFDNVFEVAGAQLDALHDPFLTCVGPAYGHVGLGGMSNANQAVHYSSHTQRFIGAMYAWAAYEALEGRNYEPLHVRDVRVLGDDIILKLNKGSVIEDTAIIPAQVNKGIEVYDGTSASQQTISSVTLEGAGQIRVSMASAPSAGMTVRIGSQITDTTGTVMQPYHGCATNFRVAQPLLHTVANGVYASEPVHEWLCADEIKL